jgi:hypothetical protein
VGVQDSYWSLVGIGGGVISTAEIEDAVSAPEDTIQVSNCNNLQTAAPATSKNPGPMSSPTSL